MDKHSKRMDRNNYTESSSIQKKFSELLLLIRVIVETAMIGHEPTVKERISRALVQVAIALTTIMGQICVNEVLSWSRHNRQYIDREEEYIKVRPKL